MGTGAKMTVCMDITVVRKRKQEIPGGSFVNAPTYTVKFGTPYGCYPRRWLGIAICFVTGCLLCLIVIFSCHLVSLKLILTQSSVENGRFRLKPKSGFLTQSTEIFRLTFSRVSFPAFSTGSANRKLSRKN